MGKEKIFIFKKVLFFELLEVIIGQFYYNFIKIFLETFSSSQWWSINRIGPNFSYNLFDKYLINEKECLPDEKLKSPGPAPTIYVRDFWKIYKIALWRGNAEL